MITVSRFEIEARDGRATASRTFIRLVEQIDEFAARTGIQVVVDDRPALILELVHVVVGLALVTSDNHHIGDEGLRPSTLCEGKKSDKQRQCF